jgi:hypothetical protein
LYLTYVYWKKFPFHFHLCSIYSLIHFFFAVAPICRPGQAQIYNVGREELAKIICEVEANPTDINFTWKFNASITDVPLDIPASDVTVDRSKSFAHYKPMTEHVSKQKQNNRWHPTLSMFFLLYVYVLMGVLVLRYFFLFG